MQVLKSLSTAAAARKLKRRRIARDELVKLTPLMNHLLDATNLAQQAEPAFLADFAFKLYRQEPVDVLRIKPCTQQTNSIRKFEHFLNEVRKGASVLSSEHGQHILTATNHFLGITQPVNDTGLDVGTHFRMSSSFGKKGRVLYTAAKFFRPERLLEIGTAYGMSAQFLMLAANRYSDMPRLDSIEAAEPQFSLSRDMLARSFPDQVRCHQGMSGDVLDQIAAGAATTTYDLVFHDGAHDAQSYREDFARLKPLLAPGALVIFDDIRWFDKRFVSSDPGCYKGWTSVVEDDCVLAAAEIDNSIGAALIG